MEAHGRELPKLSFLFHFFPQGYALRLTLSNRREARDGKHNVFPRRDL